MARDETGPGEEAAARRGRPVVDELGRRYGRLLVVAPAGTTRLGRTWSCRCDCGGERVAVGAQLRAGRVTSCGCVASPFRPRRDRTGERFGRLTVVAHLSYGAGASVRVRCDCGREIETRVSNLVSGKSSCGCLGRAMARLRRLRSKDDGGKTDG